MKTIVIAGASGLIGRAIYERLTPIAERVYGIDIGPDTNFQCNITRSSHLKNVLDTIGPIHGFVNATYPPSIYTHMEAFMVATQMLAEHMISGSIVNIASIYGVSGHRPRLYDGTDMDSNPGYHFVKGGIISATKNWAVRYAPHVRVNCISPGGVFDKQPKSFVDRYQSETPLGRMATPDDIAGPVAFLLGDDSRYITGQNIVVDGGFTL